MKYKVIGWTFSDNYEIENASLTFAARHAIIDEIKEKNFCFQASTIKKRGMAVPFLMMVKRELARKEALRALWPRLMVKSNQMHILDICLG